MFNFPSSRLHLKLIYLIGLFGETITYDLVEGGDNIPVTSENKHDFVAKYVNCVLNTSISKQVKS